VVLVYDITDRSSFDNITMWMGEIRETASLSPSERHPLRHAPEGTCVVLAGNKTDLASTRPAVTELEGR
jgi:GTPase SAR1 family protein